MDRHEDRVGAAHRQSPASTFLLDHETHEALVTEKQRLMPSAHPLPQIDRDDFFASNLRCAPYRPGALAHS